MRIIKTKNTKGKDMKTKDLLPDNIKNAEEYLEYLNATGYFDYVQELEEFKEKTINQQKLEPFIKNRRCFYEFYTTFDFQIEFLPHIEFSYRYSKIISIEWLWFGFNLQIFKKGGNK
jgi:hypothetical protein